MKKLYIILALSWFSFHCNPFSIRPQPKLLELEMVLVPGGTFSMGDFYEHKDQDALPVHTVTLPDFYISKYEITYAQYDRFATLKGYSLPEDDGHGRGDRAVVNLTWDEAKAFCECYGYRLPTEREWEYAARSGGKEELFPGVNNRQKVDDYVRSVYNSLNYSFYVGFKKPNSLGLYDMGGNVFEWIGDFYAKYPADGTEPEWMDLKTTKVRIIRGGSFKTPVQYTYTRTATYRDFASPMVGFRCVKSIKTKE